MRLRTKDNRSGGHPERPAREGHHPQLQPADAAARRKIEDPLLCTTTCRTGCSESSARRAAATEGVAEQPAPDVRTLTYEDSAIVYQVKHYVADFGEVDRVRNAPDHIAVLRGEAGGTDHPAGGAADLPF